MARPTVNNDFYDTLGEAWFEDDAHAIALLRREADAKVAYATETLRRHGVARGARVLDVGCGAGLVALPLAASGWRVHGIDAAAGAIETARRHTPAGAPATFATGDAYALDAADASFDAVLALDFLEHVERPADTLAEMARVLRPGGALVFHTFNRTPLAALVAIHGMRLAVRDCPPDVHVYRFFIPPDDLRAMLGAVGVRVSEITGLRPALGAPFWRTLARRRVHPGFHFVRTRSTAVGYIGTAIKTG